ncbi:MAG: TolC family protein [Magnetococcus sp. DMHC-8]
MPSVFPDRYCATCRRCFAPFSRWPVGHARSSWSGTGRRAGVRLALMGGTLLGLLACTIAPNPLTTKQIASAVQEDQKILFVDQEPVRSPIDLYEAVARAMKYNLDYRVAMLEKTVALSEVDLSSYDVLPRLASRAGFDSRSTPEATSGLSVTTGAVSAGYSTTQDRDRKSADLGVVWNVLDFGVSYFQAKQAADRSLVAEENRRKLAHNQFQEVQAAFWRAASAQQLQGRIDPVLAEAKAALEVAYQVEKERLRPQLEMMRFQRELLDVVQQLESLREELDLAKKNLALLINLPPGTRFELKIPDEPCLVATPIRATPAEMEQLALLNRPELRMEMYKMRISADETRKALLRLLPGLEFKGSAHYDSNSFAMDSTWRDAGLQVTGNLMKLVAGPTAIRLADNQALLAHLRRLALNMAVISQVHISHRKYADAGRKFEQFSKISEVDQRILDNVILDAGSTGQNRLDQIRAATRAIMSQLQRNKAYAELQNALGLIFVSLGVDLLPVATPDDALPALRQSIREAMLAWREGISLAPGAAWLEEPVREGPDPWEEQLFSQEVNDRLIESASAATARRAPVVPAVSDPAPDSAVPDQGAVARRERADRMSTRPEPVNTQGGAKPVAETVRAEPDRKSARKEKEAPESAPTPAEEEEGEQGAAAAETRQPKVAQPVVPQRLSVAPVPTDAAVGTVVKEWADAWTRQDAYTFLTFYSDNFLPENNRDKGKWAEAYTTLLNPAARVRAVLSDWAVEAESEEQATAFVRMTLTSSGDKWERRKTLKFRKERGGWRIVAEKTDDRSASGAPAGAPARPVSGTEPFQ